MLSKMSALYPSPKLAFHPYLPEKLGYSRVLGVLQPELSRLLSAAKPYALMSRRNLTTLYRESTRVLRDNIPGCFVEIGVHRGGSAAILAQVLMDQPNRHLHLFDRWGDLPEPTEEDGYRAEEYRKDAIGGKLAKLREDPPLEATREVLEEIIEFPKDRLHYHAGWYSETLPEYSGGPIALASVDCDYYEAVKLSLAFLDRYASPGATIIADDYTAWPGTKKAVHEWIEVTNRKVHLHRVPTGPAVLHLS
jgi:O-methyltransferase